MIPGLVRSPGEGNGYPLQYSCLENPMDRGAWQATIHRVTKNQTRQSNFHFHYWKWTDMFHVSLGQWQQNWGQNSSLPSLSVTSKITLPITSWKCSYPAENRDEGGFQTLWCIFPHLNKMCFPRDLNHLFSCSSNCFIILQLTLYLSSSLATL